MKIAAVTDIHGDVRKLAEVGPALAEVDIVLMCGDITNFGDYSEARNIISEFRVYNSNILAVPGNCDPSDAARYLIEENICLDSCCKIVDGIVFAGVGGSLPCPGRTPNEIFENDFTDRLEKALQSCANSSLILVTHQPPYGTFADMVGSGVHVGSKAIADFIVKYKPRYCFCGHIHEAAGRGMLGETEIINPGPFRLGKPAIVDIKH